ncbi:MAG: ArnT family glycosyltransferase, partial [Anaerolineales bacterium]
MSAPKLSRIIAQWVGSRSSEGALPTSLFWGPTPRALWVLFVLYLILALAYNFVFPPFEPTDEMAHFRYVRHLIEQRRFPVAQPDDTSEYHQPPLYYALAAAVSWPFPAEAYQADYAGRVNPYRAFRYWEPGLDNKNLFLHGPWDAWPFGGVSLSVHVARLASLFAGAVTVLLTYPVARSILDEQASLAATGLVAFLPMFLAVSGSLQNDTGAAACGAFFLWLGVSFYRAGFNARRAIAFGLAIGIGALMKITAVFLLAPAVLLIAAWGRAVRQPVRRALGYV